jgi:hypothetical protein
VKIDPKDRPVLLALLVVALALGLNALVSLAHNPNQKSASGKNEDPYEIPKLVLEAAEAFATVSIAGYAVLQFVESRKSSERELRAYLSVVIGGAIYQERSKPLRFEARPTLLNNGATPAYKVRYSAIAKIIPDTIAPTYAFKIPAAPPVSQSSVGPKENRILSAVYPRLIRDSRVPTVMAGAGVALWVWGIVEYEDAFQNPRYTEFCQRLYWVPDGKGGFVIMGNYDSRLGRST